MEVTANQLREGMIITRRGWVHADDRSLVVVEVALIEIKSRKGGWKGMSLNLPFLETVLIRAHILRSGKRMPTRITVPSTETFQVVRA